MVSLSNEAINQQTSPHRQESTAIAPTNQARGEASITPQAQPTGLSSVRKALTNKNISDRATDIIMQSWRKGTTKQYSTYLRKWETFCVERSLKPNEPSVSEILDFLLHLYDNGDGYSALNTARSAVSAIQVSTEGQTIGSHPLVCRFMRGVFNTRPSLPRYAETWDANMLLDYLIANPPSSKKYLRDITLRTVTLLSILSGQRVQTLQQLSVEGNCLKLNQDSCTVFAPGLLKQSRPGNHLAPLTFKCYPIQELCIVCNLRGYLSATRDLRDSSTKQLFISHSKPYKAVTTSTIGRWIKQTIGNAGVDITIFKPHSTRSASSSAAKRNGASTDLILKHVGWSRASTFAKFYDKPLTDDGLADYILPSDPDSLQ